eukprot:13237960-Alexandrium_andersonii.AAC.1
MQSLPVLMDPGADAQWSAVAGIHFEQGLVRSLPNEGLSATLEVLNQYFAQLLTPVHLCI